MTTPLLEGLNVSILGLLITFLALGVFILIMIVLQKIFPSQEESPETMEETPVLSIETDDKSEEGAVIAAIAAAAAYARSKGRSQLGAALSQSKGSWWAARRNEANQGGINRH